jgi:hypothetical protein
MRTQSARFALTRPLRLPSPDAAHYPFAGRQNGWAREEFLFLSVNDRSRRLNEKTTGSFESGCRCDGRCTNGSAKHPTERGIPLVSCVRTRKDGSGFVSCFGACSVDQATKKAPITWRQQMVPGWVGTSLVGTFQVDSSGQSILTRQVPGETDALVCGAWWTLRPDGAP